MKKIDSYKRQIKTAELTVEDQKRRIECFQGLIAQAEASLLDAVRKGNLHDDDD